MPLSLTGTSGTQGLFRKERGQDLGLEAWKVFCVALCSSVILPVQEGCPESDDVFYVMLTFPQPGQITVRGGGCLSWQLSQPVLEKLRLLRAACNSESG